MFATRKLSVYYYQGKIQLVVGGIFEPVFYKEYDLAETDEFVADMRKIQASSNPEDWGVNEISKMPCTDNHWFDWTADHRLMASADNDGDDLKVFEIEEQKEWYAALMTMTTGRPISLNDQGKYDLVGICRNLESNELLFALRNLNEDWDWLSCTCAELWGKPKTKNTLAIINPNGSILCYLEIQRLHDQRLKLRITGEYEDTVYQQTYKNCENLLHDLDTLLNSEDGSEISRKVGKEAREIRADAFEDNGGGLHLIVYVNDVAVFTHSGYEYNHGQLTADLDAVAKGDDTKTWEHNELGTCDLEEYYSDPNYTLIACAAYDQVKVFDLVLQGAGKKEFGRD